MRKALILSTGHALADSMAKTLADGLAKEFAPKIIIAADVTRYDITSADFIVGYGILRGCGDVFLQARVLGVPFYNIDHGYFTSADRNVFRVSRNNTQGDYNPNINYPQELYRWNLANNILQLDRIQPKSDGYILVCPPSLHVEKFFNAYGWYNQTMQSIKSKDSIYKVRIKDSVISLDDDLAGACSVVTFNSTVALRAICNGIPVSASNLSIFGKYDSNRDNFLSCLANYDFTTEEIGGGCSRLIHYLASGVIYG